MKLYYALMSVEVDKNFLKDKYAILEGSMTIYSKLKRKGKVHRSVLGRNKTDISEIERLSSNGNEDAKKEVMDLLVNKMNNM